MSRSDEKNALQPRVADFFAGKSILITGAAGFLGVVLLESLLRCFSGIRTIYIILREKKGVSPENRKEEIFRRKIYTKLRNENPKVFEKVRVVSGDVAKPDMGIDGTDLRDIVREVSIVFHCAASISFLKPLSFLLQQNLAGTHNIIQLCKKLKKLDVLVYTSTAYSNSNRRTEIEERVYDMKHSAGSFLEELNLGNTDKIEELASQCHPRWPNHYCISKCITENLLRDFSSDFPIAIVRPALICQTWKGAKPGYAEENSNLAQLSLGIGKGFLKVLSGDPQITIDLIPVDVVANAHIVSAWHLATNRPPSPFVVNCTSYGSYNVTLHEFTSTGIQFMEKRPLPNIMRTHLSCRVIKNDTLKKLTSLIEHYIPAHGIDLYLGLRGKKPKLVSLYRFLDKAMETSKYFMTHNWKYDVRNFQGLEKLLCSEDREDFYTDATGITLDKLLEHLPDGAPFYDWSIDKKMQKERMHLARQLYISTRVIQIFVLTFFCYSVYLLFLSVLSV